MIRYEIAHGGRVASALLLGPAAGAATSYPAILISNELIGGASVGALLRTSGYGLAYLGFSVISFPLAFLIWAVAMVVCGAPVWLLLERLRWRGPLLFAALGAAFPVLIWWALFRDAASLPGIAASGLCASLVSWRLAYRKVNTP